MSTTKRVPPLRVNLATSISTGESVLVQSLAAASRIVRAYIEANGLGASDMRQGFGDVTQRGVVVATISYNGRIWDAAGVEVQS